MSGNNYFEFYDAGKEAALTSVAWRVLGLRDEKRIDELAFSQLASFIIDIAPANERKDNIRRILFPKEARE